MRGCGNARSATINVPANKPILVEPRVGVSGPEGSQTYAGVVKKKAIYCAGHLPGGTPGGTPGGDWMPWDSFGSGAATPLEQTFLDLPCIINGADMVRLVDVDHKVGNDFVEFEALFVGITFLRGYAGIGGAISTNFEGAERPLCLNGSPGPAPVKRLLVKTVYCDFESNRADFAGAVFVGCDADYVTEHCTYNGNIASDAGGALQTAISTQNNRASITATSCSFTYNRQTSVRARLSYARCNEQLLPCRILTACANVRCAKSTTQYGGGALFIAEGSIATLDFCEFLVNDDKVSEQRPAGPAV